MIEPMLGPINSLRGARMASCIDLVICGGESGPHARPMQQSWPRLLRDLCKVEGVRFMFKQWGEWAPCSRSRMPPLIYTDEEMFRFGKGPAGRMLDGVIHDGEAW